MSKKVCHLSFNHSAFDNRIYWKELLALKEKGYQVIHIAVSDKEADFVSTEGVRIILIKRRTKHANVYLNRLFQFIVKEGSTVDVIYKKAASLQADIYHYHDLQLNAIAKKLTSLPHNPKVIYDAHEAYHLLMQEEQPKSFLLKILFSIYSKLVQRWEIKQAAYCDQIIVTDTYTLDHFQRYIPGVPCTLIYNYSYFQASPSTHSEKKYHFIYTGLINHSRGIETIISSIEAIKERLPNVKVLLIGSFETKKYQVHIENIIKAKNLNSTILIKDAVPFTEISTFYRESLVGVGLFHNTPKYTTFIPIKLFEYMAFGLPVIFSDHGPASTLIRKNNCGLLVDYLNIKEVVSKMEILLQDQKLYSTLSKNGKKAINEIYNWDTEKKKLLELYSNL